MSPPRVAILDYGCGNLASVGNAVRKVGGEPVVDVSIDPEATHVILPGQGAFRLLPGYLVSQLNAIRAVGTRSILGICLGMQLMCEGSEEAPGVKGLGWLPYQCVKMPVKRLPHIGWNGCRNRLGEHPSAFYFCHSYAAPADLDNLPEGWVTQCDDWWFVSALFQRNLWAVQFHPEKSGRAGLALLAEFLNL